MLVFSFDLDDTIWDNVPVLQRASLAQQEFLKENFPQIAERFPSEEFINLFKKTKETYPDLAYDMTFLRKKALEDAAMQCGIDPELVVEPTFKKFIEARSLVSEHIFPNVVPLLEKMKAQGFTLVSLTNGNCDVSRIPELRSIFDHNISAEMVGAAKPHPKPFEKILELTRVEDPQQIVHIGDSLTSDIMGAKKLNMKTIWINRDGKCDEQQLADFSLRCVSELENLLPVLTTEQLPN